ncbi:MAG: hypothetical protein KatS3mg108_1484 [Isosphaeraceae bacterium]|jgi:uncharacterized protein (DUF433 family)|nr:MAG: hypothetical protein KatS3mg108_1484 [Isosphaeraceae bacterium]
MSSPSQIEQACTSFSPALSSIADPTSPPRVLTAQPPDLPDQAVAAIEALFDAMRPASPLESLVLERLKQLTLRIAKSAHAEPSGPGDPAWHRYESQADRSFRATLSLYIRLQVASNRLSRSAPRSLPPDSPPSDLLPPRSADARDSQPSSPPPPTSPAELPCPPDWRDRLVIDPKIAPEWPVVRGTNLWADHVAAMLEDGWSPQEILHHYPILTLDDIATCRYADSLKLCGPWPNGIAPEPRQPSLPERPRTLADPP